MLTLQLGALLVTATLSSEAPTLRTMAFESPAVQRTMRYNVLLPPGYDDADQTYPVLYLLHGFNGNYRTWRRAALSAGWHHDLIIVMPDAGNSWYVNWAVSHDGQKNDWEDYIVHDVVNHVERNFRTLARREGRALSGFSMGGYGALMLGLRHPDRFIAVGSTSGYLDYGRSASANLQKGPARTLRRRGRAPMLEQAMTDYHNRMASKVGIAGFSSQAERSPRGTIFSTYQQADAHDPFTLIHQIPIDRLPHIYLDCGMEDDLIRFARELAAILFDKDVPFSFMQMTGRHDEGHKARSLGHLMAVQYEVMRQVLGGRASTSDAKL